MTTKFSKEDRKHIPKEDQSKGKSKVKYPPKKGRDRKFYPTLWKISNLTYIGILLDQQYYFNQLLFGLK